jgi:hypothetical protein
MLGYCMSARNPFEFFPSPTFPGVVSAFRSIHARPNPLVSASASPLFSHSCKRVCNPFIISDFNSLSFHTHAHSFPGSPLLSICSPNQRGVCPVCPTSWALAPTFRAPFCAERTARYNELLIRLHRKQSRVCGTASVAYGRFSRGALNAPPRPTPSSGKR